MKVNDANEGMLMVQTMLWIIMVADWQNDWFAQINLFSGAFLGKA